LTGRSSIPETAVPKCNASGILDARRSLSSGSPKARPGGGHDSRETRHRILAARCARVLRRSWTLFQQRAQGKPGADCTRGLPCNKKHGSQETTGSTGQLPAFPARWFTAYFALSLVTGLFCHHHPQDAERVFADLTPASGRQDHTTSPSASATFVLRCFRVHRISPQRS